MDKNSRVIAICLVVILLCLGVLVYKPKNDIGKRVNEVPVSSGVEPEKTKAIMLLIEFENTEGLANFVNETYKRNIYTYLITPPEFVEKNCQDFKKLLSYNLEIIGSYTQEPFWGMDYQNQLSIISEAKKTIEQCTKKPLRIISSRYMASDENTVKVAEELGIKYLTARGVTGTRASVFQPEGYSARILSVSNIPTVEFEYGSLCDYSYFSRTGTPEEMRKELGAALSHDKFTPVSHTYIGGFKKDWNDMWLDFFDSNKDNVDWVTIDEFMSEPDYTMPIWQIPINKNSPYTPEKESQSLDYDSWENVSNPCAVDQVGGGQNRMDVVDETGKLLMFHNGSGPMCLNALEFIKTIDYPVKQYLNYEKDFSSNLASLKSEYGESEGISDSFGYYPIIFVNGRAFSGFNSQIQQLILSEIAN